MFTNKWISRNNFKTLGTSLEINKRKRYKWKYECQNYIKGKINITMKLTKDFRFCLTLKLH